MSFLSFLHAPKLPEKQAVIYQNRSYTYRALKEEVEKRAAYFTKYYQQKNYLLAHADALENLLNFLALMTLGRVSMFAPKQLAEEQKHNILQKFSAQIIDFQLEIEENLPEYIFKKTTNTDYFLGVLSSGTTSSPKVIWKDYQSWFAAFPHQSEIFQITENDRLLVLDALGYSANLNSALHILWQGGTLVMTSLQNANIWHQQIDNQKISSIFLVPSHFRLLVKNPENLPKITSLLSAGEKLDYKTAKKLLQICPNACLTEYYGAAELGHISYHQNQDILNFGYSVGKAFPEVKISIVNQAITVDSPYISPEYRNQKTVYDLGYFVEDRVVILGRSGRMFNRRGLNVFAEEIENYVQELAFVNEVAAIGKLREDSSHDIYVVFSIYTNFTQSDDYTRLVKQYLLEKLPIAKQPRQIIEMKNLPHKDEGKIDYQALTRAIPADFN